MRYVIIIAHLWCMRLKSEWSALSAPETFPMYLRWECFNFSILDCYQVYDVMILLYIMYVYVIILLCCRSLEFTPVFRYSFFPLCLLSHFLAPRDHCSALHLPETNRIFHIWVRICNICSEHFVRSHVPWNKISICLLYSGIDVAMLTLEDKFLCLRNEHDVHECEQCLGEGV